jgi:hypothetical protein
MEMVMEVAVIVAQRRTRKEATPITNAIRPAFRIYLPSVMRIVLVHRMDVIVIRKFA